MPSVEALSISTSLQSSSIFTTPSRPCCAAIKSGVVSPFPRLTWIEGSLRRAFTTLSWPQEAAMYKGVVPIRLCVVFGSILGCWRISFTARWYPSSAAFHSCVAPSKSLNWWLTSSALNRNNCILFSASFCMQSNERKVSVISFTSKSRCNAAGLSALHTLYL